MYPSSVTHMPTHGWGRSVGSPAWAGVARAPGAALPPAAVRAGVASATGPSGTGLAARAGRGGPASTSARVVVAITPGVARADGRRAGRGCIGGSVAGEPR